MGTTAVAALVGGRTLTVGSVGDSRCYLMRGGQLTQLTRDDSWVSAAWAEGILTPEEIERHPLRNVITKAIGAKDSLDVDIIEQGLITGDVAFLCSDGLHGLVKDEEMLRLLTPPTRPLEEVAAALIAAANNAGGKDNITVVLLRYTD
jgi:protein phosphatase